MISGKCNCCSMLNHGTVVSYRKAVICGVEFTAGECIRGSGRSKRCGSIITCVINGQSVYGKVVKFFSSACNHNNGMYAYIEWMNVPDYPMVGIPIVVRVRDNAMVGPRSKILIPLLFKNLLIFFFNTKPA